MGIHPDYHQRCRLLSSIEHQIFDDLPENYDPRLRWTNCSSLNEIRDQGSCGSCWAFGAVEAMTDRICIHSNGTQQFHISAQDLITCCDNCGYQCQGGFPDAAWKYYQQIGIVTGGNYHTKQGCKPYMYGSVHNPNMISNNQTKISSDCIQKCIDEYPISYFDDKHYGSSVYSIVKNEKQIRTEIYKHGPVEASLTIYADFLVYQSGIYHHTYGDALGGHTVKILGWGVQNSTPYWLVANSWNIHWGEQGFFRIVRGTNECGIESQVLAGKPKLNLF